MNLTYAQIATHFVSAGLSGPPAAYLQDNLLNAIHATQDGTMVRVIFIDNSVTMMTYEDLEVITG